MKKLYVTVSDNVYNGLERSVHDYESFYDCKATKSLIVEKALNFYLSNILCDFDSSTTPLSTFSFTGHYSNDSLFKDDKKWTI